ncbi:MAG: excisionase family DNA-binding protein [Acidothermaceae bacterium]
MRRLITERRIAFTKVGRHIRFNTADVDEFIQAGRIEPRPSSERYSTRPQRAGAN